jgi:hypothetical protein
LVIRGTTLSFSCRESLVPGITAIVSKTGLNVKEIFTTGANVATGAGFE